MSSILLFAHVLCRAQSEPVHEKSQLWVQMQEAVLRQQDMGAVQRILKAGFNVNDPIGCGTYSALDGAVQVQNMEMVNLLLESGAKPRGSALLSAARCPNPEISVKLVEALLKKGADANFKEYYMGDSKRFSMPLHAACFLGNSQVVELLLQSPDIELNAIDIDGRTPLMCAVERGHEATISLLLEKGADPSVKNADAKTAADIAREQIKKRERILEMVSLSRRGAGPAKAANRDQEVVAPQNGTSPVSGARNRMTSAAPASGR